MEKLNFFGIGPKVGRIALPFLAVTIIISLFSKGYFSFVKSDSEFLLYIGIAFIIAGLVMYFFTLPALLKGLKETKLVTNKSFYLCCNPLYAAIILFIIPGVSFIMNSWMVLLTSVVAYILFKAYIKSEYQEMEKYFGDEYLKYRSQTPEFFPFPVKKWFRSA